jgi:ribonuclease HI
MVNRLIKELHIIKGLQIYENHIQPKRTTRQWTVPKHGHYKINVDAAISRVGGYGAVAAICRGDQGEFIAASVRVILHITDPETPEAIACSEALALAENCGIGKMIVASDCLCVIKSINEMLRCPYMMILQEIYEKAKYFDLVRFVHESRDCNREARTFAKYACTLRVGRHVRFVKQRTISV